VPKKYEGDIPTNITAIKYFKRRRLYPSSSVAKKSLFVAFRRSLK
jgi:hypothetical protein